MRALEKGQISRATDEALKVPTEKAELSVVSRAESSEKRERLR